MGVNYRLNHKYLIFAGIILSLLVLSGCIEGYIDERISGEDTSGETDLDPAENSSNETQSEVEEVCQEGYKECGKACIKEEDCCENDDCRIGEKCIDFECVSLKPEFCDFRMEWDENLGECACEEDTRWCEYQDKCIDESKCCSKFDCRGRSAEYCAPSYITLRICVENGEKSCKFISELKNEKSFTVGGERILVTFNDHVEGGLVDLSINDNPFLKVKKAQRINLENVTVFFDEFKELGGVCQDYD